MDIKSFIQLIHMGKYDNWTRRHEVIKHPCPPYELIDDKIQCFYCFQCQEQCRSRIKEYKDHYRVGKTKYYKNDLEDDVVEYK